MSAGLQELAGRGVVLLGCGKMGGALLRGWLDAGLPAEAATVLDPAAPEWLAAAGVRTHAEPPAQPAALVLAVKPQIMAEALPQVAPLAGPQTLTLSIAAGLPLAWFEARLPEGAALVRAMPNTPAAVGRGITALIANRAGEALLPRAEAMLAAVGETLRLEDEAQMDAVTALSGGGPAYVFHLIETMAAAGVAEGLAPEAAMRLARATVCGAGELARRSEDSAEALRVAVTSPGGTTAEALRVLMDAERGLPPLMRRAVAAATERGRQLGA